MSFTGRCGTVLLACALAALPAVLTPSSQSAAQAKNAANAYTLHVAVTDEKGNAVEGLRREAFAVYAGGRPVDIVSFDNADAPASVAVVLDASGSMDDGETARTRNALLRFFRNCHARDEFFVGVFNHGQQLLVDGSNDPQHILSALDRYALSKNRGQTALFDALYLAMNRVAKGRHTRRAVLLVTDGVDNASSYTFDEMKRAVRESDVTVYAVTLTRKGYLPDLVGTAILSELTEPTGGLAIFPQGDKELNAALIYVAGELRSQYALGVVPAPAARKGNWYDIKIKMTKGRDTKGKLHKLTARTREGFYWPEKGS